MIGILRKSVSDRGHDHCGGGLYISRIRIGSMTEKRIRE